MLDLLKKLFKLKQMLNYQTSLVRVFRALADPTRRVIIDQLSKGTATVSDIAAPLDMSLAAVVQHIQVLEESGIITTQKTGRVRTCRIEPDVLAQVERWISHRRSMWERQFDRLGVVLEEQKSESKTGKDIP